MKYLVFVLVEDMAQATEVSKASDKLWANPPPGAKMAAAYVCLGNPFPAVLPPKLGAVSIAVMEADSHEALMMSCTPALNAGAMIYSVPVLDMPVTGAAELTEKIKG